MTFDQFSTFLGLDDRQKRKVDLILSSLHTRLSDLLTTSNNDSAMQQLVHQFCKSQKVTKDFLDILGNALNRSELNGVSKFLLVSDLERSSKILINALLSYEQQQLFLCEEFDTLLSIDIGEKNFLKVLEKTFLEEQPSGFVCTAPFEYTHIQANGDVYPCCPSKFGKIIGNVTVNSLAEIWKSPEAESVRDSIKDGSYVYCNAAACEYLRKANADKIELSPKVLVDWLKGKKQLDAGKSPQTINLGSDRICNLACRYCRSELYKPSEEDKRRISLIDKNIFDGLSHDSKRIILLGEGDPFASPIYLDKLRNYDWQQHPNLKVKIQTNGLLLTPAMWQSIEKSHPVIDWISVSIDAATPETYKINRGGSFDKLLKNLEFISELIVNGRIKKFWINFLVQKNNFREMIDFVKLGKRLKCNLIEFQRFENWGVISDAEYRHCAVHEPWHEDHKEFVDILKDPILSEEGIWLLKVSEKHNTYNRISTTTLL